METTTTDIEITTSSPENPSNAANSAAPTETVINTVTTIVIPKESITELKTTTNNDNVDAPMKISTATITTSPIPSSSNGENIIVTELPQKQDKMDQQGDLINFKVLYVLTQLCGLTLIVLMGTWVGVYMGGTAWTSDPAHEFNWHPLFMTIGLIYLYGNGILVYRGFRNFRKKGLKLAHAGIHMSAFILTVIALVAAFDSHNLRDPPIPNMYTLHSWLGISAVGLFSLQYVLGFVMFLFPMAREQLRAQFMPLHIYFGLFGFVLAIASALMGLTEKAIFSIPNYALLPPSGVMVNIMGVLFVIFGGLVVYLTTEREYKRKPLPEDTKLLTGASE